MENNINKIEEAGRVCEEIFVICHKENKRRKNPIKRVATLLAQKFNYEDDDAKKLAEAFYEVSKVVASDVAPVMETMGQAEKVAFIVSLVAQNLSALDVPHERQLVLLEPFCDEMGREVIKMTRQIIKTVEQAFETDAIPEDALARAASRLGSALGAIIDLNEDELNLSTLENAPTLTRFIKACFQLIREKMTGYEMSSTYSNQQLLDFALSLEDEEKAILESVRLVEAFRKKAEVVDDKGFNYKNLVRQFQVATFATADATCRLKSAIDDQKLYH